jgi:hypothetical protein
MAAKLQSAAKKKVTKPKSKPKPAKKVSVSGCGGEMIQDEQPTKIWNKGIVLIFGLCFCVFMLGALSVSANRYR